MRLFPASFKRSLSLHFIIAAVLPILVLGIVGIQYSRHRHLQATIELLDTHALNVSHEATEFLEDTSRLLDQVAGTLTSGLLGDGEIDRYLQAVTRASGSFESIFILNAERRVVNLGLHDEGRNASDYIGLDFSRHGIFKNQSRERTARTAGKLWSDTFLSSVTVEPSVTVGMPLGDGTLVGTVSLQKLSSELRERLESAGSKYNFSILDHNGIVIADSRPGITSQRLNLRMHAEIREALDKQVERPFKFHEDNSLIESVKLISGTGWVAYVSVPVNVALQGIDSLRYALATALLSAALLGVALSVWLSRRMLRPILRLREAAGEIAAGNYNQNLKVEPYEELAALGNSFRGMITAVEDREHSIRESRARFRDLVNSIDGIVWELDLADFRFTFVSEQAEQILGYPAQRWIDEERFWFEHVHADDQTWVLSYCQTETDAKRDHDFEYRMIAADGRTVWLKDVVSVILEDDKPVRLRGVMLDITTRKEAEIVLQETTDRLQLLIERMPLGCIAWDASDRAVLWNPAAERIFGFAAAEVIGKGPLEFLVPEESRDKVAAVFERIKAGEQVVHNINRNLTKDGHTITCEWHNTALRNPEGGLRGVVSMAEDITQRVVAEEALKESELRFRTIFQTNPDAVMISRFSDGRIISVNDNASKMTGFSRDELLSSNTLGLNFWVDPSDRVRYLQLAEEQGLVENFSAPVRRKDGRVRTALLSARVLNLKDEKCLLNVVRDITVLKQAEERLSRSEERFRSLVAAMGDGLLILSHEGEIVHCNRAAERIMDFKAEDVVGLFINDLITEAFFEDGSPCEPSELPSNITLRTGEAVNNRITGLRNKNGDMTWLQVNTQPLGLDKNDRPIAMVVSFADVTRLKRIESDLRRNEKNLRTLTNQFRGVLESIPDQIVVLDREMRVVWLKHRFEDGLSGQVGAAGRPCHKVPEISCGPASGNAEPLCDSCPIKQSFQGGKKAEARLELADGRVLALRSFPICDEDGEIINVIEIVQDITDEIRQQAQAMRAGQLAALGELAAGVAHEINNPINGVINYAQLILNKAAEDSREVELSKRIIKESERVASIVRELLYFAREESHETHKVRVAEALGEALSLVQHQLNKEGVLLELELPEDLPKIVSRSHQIQQLFLNLISNSRYALTERYPDAHENKIMRIRAAKIVKGDMPFVRVVFRDHGTGIDAELLPRVLNPFTTTKPAGEGTGLGLSISHEIVQKHGGTLSIDSIKGEFTEVVVELPAVAG